MSQLAEQLNNVMAKVAKLISICTNLQEENLWLKQEKGASDAFTEEARNKIKELEERVEVLKMARSLEGFVPDGDNADEKPLDIKQKIDEFVREIDKCIVLLKK